MQWVFTSRQVAYGLCLLAGSLILVGCPRHPGVAMGPPSTIGPGAGAAPRASGDTPAPKSGGETPVPMIPNIAEVPVTRSSPPAELPVKPAPAAAEGSSPLKDIFFEFDDARIQSDQQAALDSDFAYLRAHPGVKVRVEGNCDERGTEEYNLALGQQRAEAAKRALVAQGITADRIATISYGEDKPFDPGHDEKAWRLNRRAHFVVLQ